MLRLHKTHSVGYPDRFVDTNCSLGAGLLDYILVLTKYQIIEKKSIPNGEVVSYLVVLYTLAIAH